MKTEITTAKWQQESEIYSLETAHQPAVKAYRWNYRDNLPDVAQKLFTGTATCIPCWWTPMSKS